MKWYRVNIARKVFSEKAGRWVTGKRSLFQKAESATKAKEDAIRRSKTNVLDMVGISVEEVYGWALDALIEMESPNKTNNEKPELEKNSDMDSSSSGSSTVDMVRDELHDEPQSKPIGRKRTEVNRRHDSNQNNDNLRTGGEYKEVKC